MTEKPRNFWSSIPGILTGIAAVITAISGFIAINNNRPQTPPQPPTPPTTVPGNKPDTVVGPSPTIKPKPSTPILPFPVTGALIDCELFPTVNTTTSLMGWSDYYHKQIADANGISSRQAADPCNKAIDYRGMAHCKDPESLEIRQALLETLTLCRAAGIEWQNIQHSTIAK